MPWLDRYLDLERAAILEIGCGTGASTVTLATDESGSAIDSSRGGSLMTSAFSP